MGWYVKIRKGGPSGAEVARFGPTGGYAKKATALKQGQALADDPARAKGTTVTVERAPAKRKRTISGRSAGPGLANPAVARKGKGKVAHTSSWGHGPPGTLSAASKVRKRKLPSVAVLSKMPRYRHHLLQRYKDGWYAFIARLPSKMPWGSHLTEGELVGYGPYPSRKAVEKAIDKEARSFASEQRDIARHLALALGGLRRNPSHEGPTLNAVLKAGGYTTSKAPGLYRKRIKKGGKVVFEGTAHEVWQWLKKKKKKNPAKKKRQLKWYSVNFPDPIDVMPERRGILPIKAYDLKDAKDKARKRLRVKRLPRGTDVSGGRELVKNPRLKGTKRKAPTPYKFGGVATDGTERLRTKNPKRQAYKGHEITCRGKTATVLPYKWKYKGKSAKDAIAKAKRAITKHVKMSPKPNRR